MDRAFIRASPEYDEKRLLRRAWDRCRFDLYRTPAAGRTGSLAWLKAPAPFSLQKRKMIDYSVSINYNI